MAGEKDEVSVIDVKERDKEEEDVKKSKSIGQRYRDFFMYQVCIPLVLLATAAAFLGVGWFICPVCVVCVFLFSACTCAYIPVMNIPLWISIVILIWQGWKVTDGALTVAWK